MRLATMLLAAVLACGAAGSAWAGTCDLGCNDRKRQECLADCKKDKAAAASCKVGCEEMAASCKKVCEAALKHVGKPDEMQAAVKEALRKR